MPLWLHVLACVVVPAGWGVVMYFVFSFVDARRVGRRQQDEPPPIDYTI